MSAFQGLILAAVRIGLALLFVSCAAFSARPASAANFVVGTGTAGSCTEAAFDAAFFAVQAAGGTITFNCGAAPVTILFSTVKTVSASTVIEGGGRVTLSGANTVGLFQVFSGHTLTLNQVTITRGFSPSGAVENFGTLKVTDSHFTMNASTASGGGILNHGTLTVVKSTFTGNNAAQVGGGIHTDSGAASITNSVFSTNTAVQGGGAIAATGGANLAVTGSRFESNRATDTFAQGGALLNDESTAASQVTSSTFYQNSSSRGGAVSVLSGTVSIEQSIFEGNWSAYGGGIRQEGGTLTLNRVKLVGNGYSPSGSKVNTGGGALSWGNGTAVLTDVSIHNNWASYGGGFDHENGSTTLTNVTISGNQAVGSGGFDTNGGSITLVNVTVAKNSAGFFSGGIGNRNGTLVLKNTLVSGNFNSSTLASWNCNKAIGSTPFSLSSDFTCDLGTGRNNVNILLGPLESDGQYSLHYKLLRDSPAIDAAAGADCPPSDQRGVNRPQGSACDIGAIEVTSDDLMYRIGLPLVTRSH
jgi:hypothetical protein